MRQQSLDEHVLVEDHVFADARRAEGLEARADIRRLGGVLPVYERTQELHEGDALHKIGSAPREMEAETRSPILQHQIGRANAYRRDEGVEAARLIEEAVPDVRLARLAKPIRSGAMQRATGATGGRMFRQM